MHRKASASSVKDFLQALSQPPNEYGPFPFWFWNDDLDESELLSQLRMFRDGGIGGVVIHPRVGLSRRIGYLTDEYFRLVRLVVDECAKLDMKVVLYDEGSYPSGSACGLVVESNPEFAAKALALVHKQIDGPWTGYWRPHINRSIVDRTVCVVLGRESDAIVDPESLVLLESNSKGLVRVDVPEGAWRLMACIQTYSGGTIRGVHDDQDDAYAVAPPAGDIMDPAAVGKFVELTHDAYARHLKEHMGKTVVAMFTDEPNPLGRNHRRGVKPFTNGLDDYISQALGRDKQDIHKWLPALWLEYGAGTQAFRSDYERVVHQRIAEVFYTAQSKWCERHDISLTGHPNASNDMSSLSTFHWPGQDMVWRWVVPGNESGLEGNDSVAPKAATSAARALGRRHIVTEIYGAYGWGLSLDEAKWLADWHLVRGNNLFLLHAFFYSIREGRAFESEPDLGVHNVWWRHFQQLIMYIRRMSWLLTDCEHVCDVAVLGTGHDLPWKRAKALYESQIDFLYIDEASLEGASVDANGLRVGSQRYRTVIVDGDVSLGQRAREVFDAFVKNGGQIVSDHPGHEPEDWVSTGPSGKKVSDIRATLRIDPPNRDLRVMHVRKAGRDVFILTNEGENPVQGNLTVPTGLAGDGAQAIWINPLRMRVVTETMTSAGSRGELHTTLNLSRRESLLLVMGSGGEDAEEVLRTDLSGFELGDRYSCEVRGGEPSGFDVTVSGPWQVTDQDGTAIPLTGLEDWTSHREMELFSGTLVYQTSVNMPIRPTHVVIDLGEVGDAAEVRVNGTEAGSMMWSPYLLLTDGALWTEGNNELEVRVTNSMANRMEGALRPSGLLGPVQLIVNAL